MPYFTTNCTLPAPGSTYVSAPNTRGTLTISWSCLSTIILCTWNIQHLNIPIQARAKDLRQKTFRKLYYFAFKLAGMALTIIAPEYILGKAVLDKLSAYHSVERMKDLTRKDQAEWTESHAYLANMGGFELLFDEDRIKKNNAKDLESSTTISRASSTDHDNLVTGLIAGTDIRINSQIDAGNAAHPPVDAETKQLRDTFRGMLGWKRRGLDATLRSNQKLSRWIGQIDWSIRTYNRNLVCEVIANVRPEHVRIRERPWFANMIIFQGDRWHLNAPQLFVARSRGLIASLPDITEDEVEDRNKGDFLVKGIAMLQISWLIAQLITRATKRLPVSQLEILTLSYAVSAVFTYGIVFSKPQDVKTPTTIYAARDPTAQDLIELANECPTSPGMNRTSHTIPHRAVHGFDHGRPYVWIMAGSGAGGVLFGGLHCIAWSFDFPTAVEQLLWRIAALLTMGVPVLGLLANWFFYRLIVPRLRKRDLWLPGRISYTSAVLLSIPYILARLYVLVEVFRALVFLPPLAYQATWASNAPQIL